MSWLPRNSGVEDESPDAARPAGAAAAGVSARPAADGDRPGCGRERILVSACLLGDPVRYDGKSQPCEAVQALAGRFELIPVCPECLGGLPVPRTASEIDTRSARLRVTDRRGEDRTEAFLRGARACVEMARSNGCRLAVMKAKSPSCGRGHIYDGSFSGLLVPGNGVATRALVAAGVCVLSENDVENGGLESFG